LPFHKALEQKAKVSVMALAEYPKILLGEWTMMTFHLLFAPTYLKNPLFKARFVFVGMGATPTSVTAWIIF